MERALAERAFCTAAAERAAYTAERALCSTGRAAYSAVRAACAAEFARSSEGAWPDERGTLADVSTLGAEPEGAEPKGAGPDALTRGVHVRAALAGFSVA